MTSEVGRRPSPAAPTISGVPLLSRIYGFGSVFGKTMRDSRRAILLVGVLLGVTLIGVSNAIVSQFATPASRQELVDIVDAVPPILQGLAGKPVNVGTLGGYLQYKYGAFFPLIAEPLVDPRAVGDAGRRSAARQPRVRRGHGDDAAPDRAREAVRAPRRHGDRGHGDLPVARPRGPDGPGLPGDEISLQAAAGYAIWLGLLALASGSVAFALAPFVGRGSAAGVAGAFMFGGFIVNGYQAAIPALAPLANLSWFGWTSNHIPLAGVFDWPSLVPVAVVSVVLLVVGVEAFARRDIGATSPLPSPSLPRALVGLRGPTGRAVGQNLPSALAWGLGLGLFGLAIAGSGRSFIEELGNSPDFVRLLSTVFPGFDIGSVGGFLQLLYVEFGFILVGLAAATLVSVWASDETSGRLEFLLATPLSRVRWLRSGWTAILVGVAVVTVIAALGIALGAGIAGSDIATPVVGSLVLGLYAAALAGVGVAIGGVFGTSYAGPAVAVITIVSWFVDVLGPALGLPEPLRTFALTGHYGFTMLGQWDPVGIVASIVIAVGGVAIGAWGFRRRDLRS